MSDSVTGAVLIVEDHPLFRRALVDLAQATLPELQVVTASSAEEALRLAREHAAVRLVLLDPGLPGVKGAEAVGALCRACPSAWLIAISASDDRRDVAAAFRAGAQAFISKAASTEVLGALLRRVLAGELARPEWITAQGKPRIDEDLPLALTLRQREILSLLAQGHSNKEIGLRLVLAEITVKMHVSAIFRALGVANRTQAVIAARDLGLLAP